MAKTLTKLDIIRQLADRYRMQYADSRRIVQGTLDMVIDALMQGKKVELRNFGIFEVVERKGRIARNIKDQKSLHIPPRKVVRFRQGKIMDEEITSPSLKGLKPTPANEPPRAPDQRAPE